MGVNSTPELSETTKVVTKLLDFNFSTCLLELALDRLSLLLGDTLLNGLGSTVDQRLGIAQRQTCDLLNDLDHLEFRLTCVFQDDIERRLLGGGSLAGTGCGSSSPYCTVSSPPKASCTRRLPISTARHGLP